MILVGLFCSTASITQASMYFLDTQHILVNFKLWNTASYLCHRILLLGGGGRRRKRVEGELGELGRGRGGGDTSEMFLMN